MTPFWAVVGVVGTILGSLILNMVSNECSDLAPWLARRLVRWAAHRQYRGGERAQIRAEEWSRIIQDRPGKLLKLATALWFATVALTHPAPQTRVNGPSLPWLGRASAQAGIALAVASFVGCAEFWLAATYQTRAVTLGGYLLFGTVCAVPAALETLARDVPRLPQGVLSGGLGESLGLLLTSTDPHAIIGEDIQLLGIGLGMGPALVFAVRLAVRVLARGRTGVAVYTAVQIVALGTFTAFRDSFDPGSDEDRYRILSG